MRAQSRFLSLIILVFLLGSVCQGATVTGTVKGPDGAPFQGAFVQAQNVKNKVMTSVLSDTRGRYRIENLPAGEYRVQIKAVGYTAAPQTSVNLSADQNTSFDFALQKGVVHWNDINFTQAAALWPAGKGKDLIFARCSICHEFQTRMASVRRDADGWKDRLDYMRTVMHYDLWNMPDEDANAISTYLTSLFGPDSVLPKSPEDMPNYKQTVRPFGADSLNIVYVEYDMAGPSHMPFSATPDKNGDLWIPNAGPASRISRLNPKTGEMTDFLVPPGPTAGVHSTIPAADGTVWIAEQGRNNIAKWDPKTQQITEFHDPYLPGKEGTLQGGERHTIRLDSYGNVWSSGNPLTKFDPETGKFADFPGINTYDVKPDKSGNLWFTSPGFNKFGKVEIKTMKVTQWESPTPKSGPRRMELGPDGMVYMGEFTGGKILRFDPKTETFKEFVLPGPDPSPYALGFDRDGYLWYDSHHQDIMGRFDPRTGNVIEYPFPAVGTIHAGIFSWMQMATCGLALRRIIKLATSIWPVKMARRLPSSSLCSARLQASMRLQPECPPEGGRYKAVGDLFTYWRI